METLKKMFTKLKNNIIQIFPIFITFYICLNSLIPRSSYIFLTEKTWDKIKYSENENNEDSFKIKIRRKIIQDFKIHACPKHLDKKTVVKIIIDNEGKIIGYKLYKTFFPNYFTKTQVNYIFKKRACLDRQNSNLHYLKIEIDKLGNKYILG